MAIVTPSSLNPKYPATPFASTAVGPTVREQFEVARDYAGSAFSTAAQYLEILKVLFAQAEMPETDISYEFQELSLDTEIESSKPTPPTDEQLTPTKPTLPTLGEIPSVDIPSIVVPEEDFGDLEVDFDFDEPSYTSALIDAVKTALLAYVQSGGTGLGAEVEAAIWARARARQELVNERVYAEALAFFSARGHELPPGALAGRLAEAVAEQTRADTQMNYEVMIEQARLAKDQGQKVLEVSVALEGVEKEFADKIAGRAFEKAKAAVDIITNTYNAKVAAYVARVEACKAKADVAVARANAQVAQGTQVVAVFTAELDRYKADLASELGIIETIAKVYNYKMNGYETEAKVAIGILDVQLREYEGRLKQADNQTQLALKEAELILQGYLGALALQQEAAKGGAQVAAQVAASALSSVNASAAIGFSMGRGQHETIGHTTHISEAAALSERHSYDHEV